VLVETKSLTKRYGEFVALDNCDLSVKPGEIFGLLGPNGAGKTTLIRLLLGFLRPSSGTATIDGHDCYRHRVKVHQLVSYLPADAKLYRSMKGRDVLRFFSNVRGNGDFDLSLVLADRLELDTSRRVGFMSTGMRQKLALAAVFSANTSMLVLDEPTANLDPNVRSEIAKMVLQAKEQGRTVLFSSHVLSEVEEVCDRVVILRRGKLVHDQIMKELRSQHQIHGYSSEKLKPPPNGLAEQISIHHHGEGQVLVKTPGDIAPLLQWLADSNLKNVSIERQGLRAVYDRYHLDNNSASDKFDSLTETRPKPS